MKYLTVKDETKSEFTEKKSLFIGHACRVYSEEEAIKFIEKIKTIHKDATHNVPAYIIGENREIQRYSDDGEPQGTAGIPALEVLKKKELTDTVIVITRYFGGTLLGSGGLIRAYSKAASLAVEEAGIVEKVKGSPLYISCGYDLLGKIQYNCGQNSWYIENIEYTDKIKLLIFVAKDNLDKLKNTFTEITKGTCHFEQGQETYFFKLDNHLMENI